MPTFKSLASYRATLQKRINKIKKGGVKSSKKASRLLVNEAKKLAPKDSGETIRGIRRRKGKDGYFVESVVKPKGVKKFRQNMWADQRGVHATPRMVWNGKRKTLYGDGTHNITGRPGFFRIATALTRQKFIRITNRETVNALRVKL